MNLFLQAAKQKTRFSTTRGLISVEQLFDLPLTAKDNFSLDNVARGIAQELKAAGDESFVSSGKNPANAELTFKLEVVKAVIADREADNAAKTNARATASEVAQLQGLLATKEQEALANLSADELRARLAKLQS